MGRAMIPVAGSESVDRPSGEYADTESRCNHFNDCMGLAHGHEPFGLYSLWLQDSLIKPVFPFFRMGYQVHSAEVLQMDIGLGAEGVILGQDADHLIFKERRISIIIVR